MAKVQAVVERGLLEVLEVKEEEEEADLLVKGTRVGGRARLANLRVKGDPTISSDM